MAPPAPPAERVVRGLHRRDPRREGAPPLRSERQRGGFLWAPVGDPRAQCGTALSVSPKAARRLDTGQFVHLEIDDRLQCLVGGAVVQRLGQGLEPHGLFGLEPEE